MGDTTRPDAEQDLITLEDCRQLLGDEADGLSDEDLDQVRRHAASLARVLIEMALESQASERLA